MIITTVCNCCTEVMNQSAGGAVKQVSSFSYTYTWPKQNNNTTQLNTHCLYSSVYLSWVIQKIMVAKRFETLFVSRYSRCQDGSQRCCVCVCSCLLSCHLDSVFLNGVWWTTPPWPPMLWLTSHYLQPNANNNLEWEWPSEICYSIWNIKVCVRVMYNV